VLLKTAEKVLQRYRGEVLRLSVRHFSRESDRRNMAFKLSYKWVKMALQGAGLVRRQRRRRKHRRRRVRRPLPGMLLHINASKHAWFGDGRY
jgi:hypothetical protein